MRTRNFSFSLSLSSSVFLVSFFSLFTTRDDTKDISSVVEEDEEEKRRGKLALSLEYPRDTAEMLCTPDSTPSGNANVSRRAKRRFRRDKVDISRTRRRRQRLGRGPLTNYLALCQGKDN